MTTIIISIITIISLIIMIIFKPTIKIKKIELQTFWIIPVIGLIILLLLKQVDFEFIKDSLFRKSSINPIEILTLFLSISFLSIVLDEAGFFKKCALLATKINGGSQKKLYFSLMLVISCLTIFTSNDIVILTFTPFICYFCKHSKVSPIPYLIEEFIFANTCSMMLIIGNPTNIYLAESFNISFFEYFKIMFIPTIITSIIAYILLSLIFKKQLNKTIQLDDNENQLKINKFIMITSLIHLALCTILLAIASYINLKMWIICLAFAISLLFILSIYSIFIKNNTILNSLKRLPYNLIPFILSMFIIVAALTKVGAIKHISNLFDATATSSTSAIFEYGLTAFFTCNILNNIPMSVMFEQIISSSNQFYLNEEIYSSIIASNIGAYLSPIGALAGIMWMSLLKKADIRFNFTDFLKYGVLISPLLIIVALTTLTFII